MTSPKTVYQLKVTLNNIKPPIWRRILVPDTVTLFQLHTILQTAMGWTDSHLHMFTINEQIYGDPEDDEFGELDSNDESRYRLNQFVYREGFKFRYEYDFGDSWLHTLRVEKILPAEKGVRYPVCVAGKHACPPEDVGGIGGYANFLDAITNPKHDEHNEYLTWVGGEFDSKRFDMDGINALLHNQNGRADPRSGLFPSPLADIQTLQKITTWAQRLGQERLAWAGSLAVLRDMLTFLKYLTENRITTTQSTGNLPLKAVRAICPQFVNPPEVEFSIGSYQYHIRSETDVEPLYFLHQLANAGGLVTGGLGRVCRVSPDGNAYLGFNDLIQVGYLLWVWWNRVDWSVTYQFEGFYRGVPPEFKDASLASLLELKIGESIPFELFADDLIKKSHLIWPIDDQVFAKDIMRSVTQYMVIQPLEVFGVLECEYNVKHILAGHDLSDLTSLRLTTPGKEMLDILK